MALSPDVPKIIGSTQGTAATNNRIVLNKDALCRAVDEQPETRGMGIIVMANSDTLRIRAGLLSCVFVSGKVLTHHVMLYR